MRLQLYNIIPCLRPYVKLICTMECDHEADTRQIRVLPDTCAELFLNYTTTPVAIIDHELHERSIITFRMSKPMDVQMRKGTGCLAICFHPGMAYPFFGIPMHVLSDTVISLSDLWNEMALDIEGQLADLYCNQTRADLVQKLLLQKLASQKEDVQVAACLRQVQLSGGPINVRQLSSKTGLSQRQLSRRFQQSLGLSPKEYLRVSRFLSSLKHLKKYPNISLTDVAYESGYYDQAHFIRDCKTYTGHSPRELVHAQHILY